jgi:hypothetical protein
MVKVTENFKNLNKAKSQRVIRTKRGCIICAAMQAVVVAACIAA